MSLHIVSILTILLSANCWAGEKVVDLIIVAGQSNAVGFHTRASELPQDPGDLKVMFWWKCGDPPADEYDSSCHEEWTTLKPQPKGNPAPKGAGNFGYAEGGFGPEMGVARTLLKKQPDRPLAIVKVAYNATGIGHWNPESGKGKGYTALMGEIKLALEKAKARGITLRPRALVWCQGESDSNRNADTERYRTQLENMISSLRKDLDAPELIALLGLNTKFGLKNSKATGPNANVSKIVKAQKAIASSSEYVEYVDDWGCEVVNVAHFGSKGTLELGGRYAEALIKTEEKLKRSKEK